MTYRLYCLPPDALARRKMWANASRRALSAAENRLRDSTARLADLPATSPRQQDGASDTASQSFRAQLFR